MSLRARILLASVLLVIVPLAVLAVGVRREMSRRLGEQYARRAEALATVIEDDLARQGALLAERLAPLSVEIADDNRFRLAAVSGQADQRPYLLDFASREMRLLGLSMLQIQDEHGRILSSGHYRNEYDRLEPALPRLLANAPAGTALVRARRPEGTFLALARVDSLTLGARRFTLVAGIEVDAAFLARLARDEDLAVSIVTPDGTLSTDARAGAGATGEDRVVRSIDLPLLATDPSGGERLATARLVVSHSLAPLRDLLRRLDRWLAALLAATAAGTIALALWLSAQISRPLDALARKTARIDLDRLDADFSSRRADEVGALSRFLAEMTARLRKSTEALREAERRATLGDMARQVNHDVRNAMTPIRNVVRHLGEVARGSPERLGGVFLEREATIESSLAYLEALAANYARLSPRPALARLDVNEIVRDVARPAASGVNVRVELAEDLPPVMADPVGFRRIAENLLRNARESYEGNMSGDVILSTESAIDAGGGRVVRLVVRDTGRGMSAKERERIFDDFYTTKAEGTGLGLSIVKRLVSDFEGTVAVESTPGRGTTVTVTLPAAAALANHRAPGEARP